MTPTAYATKHLGFAVVNSWTIYNDRDGIAGSKGMQIGWSPTRDGAFDLLEEFERNRDEWDDSDYEVWQEYEHVLPEIFGEEIVIRMRRIHNRVDMKVLVAAVDADLNMIPF